MEILNEFFETSTIHGLSWIPSTRKWLKFFWIFVVVGGFTGAGYLILQSFNNWAESPVSTTIETLPISKITFPNVTICPPQGLFLDLNYDVAKADKIQLNNDVRKHLIDYAVDVIQTEFYREMMVNLSKLEDPDRYYNWYHENSLLTYPFYNDVNHQLYYYVYTSAKSGNISTHHFGDSFNATKGSFQ